MRSLYHERCTSKEAVEPSSVVKESHWGVWKKSPFIEGQRSCCMKLWRWSLDCIREPKMSEMPEAWGICQGELQTGNGTIPRKKKMCGHQQSWKDEHSKPFDIQPGATGFGVCTALFPSCFGSAFPHYGPFPLFWKDFPNGIFFICWELTLIFRRLQLRDCLAFRKRLWTFNLCWDWKTMGILKYFVLWYVHELMGGREWRMVV